MAGYSKGIVDTRKLNENSKAKLGRGGDTKIREVDNRASHVNALEAYLIDVNGKAGEDYAKRVGAGTVNPLTGMPEYTHEVGHSSSDLMPLGGLEGRQDYETLSNLSQDELEIYLRGEFDIGADKMQYIEPFEQEPFGFLRETQALTTGRAGDIRGFAERGLESAYGTTMGTLGSREKALGLQMGDIRRTAERGFDQTAQGAGQATRESNMAFSGTITQGLETQKKQLFQDYTAGSKGVQIGMEDIGRERGTALETLTLGKEEAAATEQYTTAGADLDFRTAEYAEKKRQLDQMYADIGSIPS